MTEINEHGRTRMLSPSAARRREAKSRARALFHTEANSLTMIAAILLPVILFVALQGLYSMVYITLPEQMLAGADMIAWTVILALTLPLLGGTLYITQGLLRGEKRHARDVFCAYTSPKAYLRALAAVLLPLCLLAVSALVNLVIFDLTNAMCNIVSDSEKWSIYIDLFLSAGDLFIALTTFVGILLSGWFFPLAWLICGEPHMPLIHAVGMSIRAARGHLGEILLFHLSFLGWMLLSVCTVGILLVLFVLPYYLLAASCFACSLCRDVTDREAATRI